MFPCKVQVNINIFIDFESYAMLFYWHYFIDIDSSYQRYILQLKILKSSSIYNLKIKSNQQLTWPASEQIFLRIHRLPIWFDDKRKFYDNLKGTVNRRKKILLQMSPLFVEMEKWEKITNVQFP